MHARIAAKSRHGLLVACLSAALLLSLFGGEARASRLDLVRFDVQISIPFSDVVIANQDEGFQFSLPLLGAFVSGTLFDLVMVEAGARWKLPKGYDDWSWDVILRAGISFPLVRAKGWRGFELRVPLLVGYSHLEVYPEESRYDTETYNFVCFDTGLQLTYWFSKVGLTLRPLVGLRISGAGMAAFSGGGTFGLSF